MEVEAGLNPRLFDMDAGLPISRWMCCAIMLILDSFQYSFPCFVKFSVRVFYWSYWILCIIYFIVLLNLFFYSFWGFSTLHWIFTFSCYLTSEIITLFRHSLVAHIFQLSFCQLCHVLSMAIKWLDSLASTSLSLFIGIFCFALRSVHLIEPSPLPLWMLYCEESPSFVSASQADDVWYSGFNMLWWHTAYAFIKKYVSKGYQSP